MRVAENRLPATLRDLKILILIIATHILVTSTLLRGGYYDTLHPLIAMLFAKSPAELCTRLNYSPGSCNPLVNILWFASRIVQSELVAYMLAIVGVVSVYMFTKLLVGGKYAPTLAALLYAYTPTVLYPALLDYYGFVLLTPLILVSLVFTVKGLVDNNTKLVIIGCILQAIILTTHNAYWAFPLGILFYLLVNYAKRKLTRLERAVLIYLAIITMARLIFSVPGYEYFLALFVVILTLGLVAIDVVIEQRDISARSLLNIFIFILAVVLSITAGTTLGARFQELSVKLTLAPLVVFGLTGILALGGFMLVLRGGGGGLSHIAIIFSVVFTVLSLLAPSLTLLAVAFMATLSGFLLESVISTVELTRSRRLRVLGYISVIGLLTATIFTSVGIAIDHHYTTHPVLSRITPLVDRGAQARIYEWLSHVSSELSSRILEDSAGRRVLIIANWEYSYWLYVELAKRGLDVYLLSNIGGNISDKSLIAKIFTTNEEVSKLILRNVSRDLGIEDVYVVVLCDFSVQRGFREGEAQIGHPYRIVEIRRRELFFGTRGDLVLMPLYLSLANRSLSDYLTTQYLDMLNVYDESVLALSWTSTGAETLMVKLVISALHGLNYTSVYNRLYRYIPLSAELTWYRLFYVNAMHLKSINIRDFGVYDVYLLLGVFKVQF